MKKSTKKHKGIWYYDNMELEGAELLKLPLLFILGDEGKEQAEKEIISPVCGKEY